MSACGASPCGDAGLLRSLRHIYAAALAENFARVTWRA
jgi:hypothetical protein